MSSPLGASRAAAPSAGTSWAELVRSDLRRIDPAVRLTPASLLLMAGRHPGFAATALLRTQQVAYRRGFRRTAWALRFAGLTLTGSDLVPGAEVGPGLLMNHPTGVVVGAGAVIGSDCTVLQNVTVGERHAEGRPPHDYPVIGDGVTLGAGAVVLGDVHVEDGATVGANAVVLADVPAGATAIGVPARVLPGSVVDVED